MVRRAEASEPAVAGTPIPCPHCGRVFELTEALAAPLIEARRRELDARTAEREAELAERERQLAAERADVEARNANVAAEVAARLAAERVTLSARLEREAREKVLAERDAVAEDARRHAEAQDKKVGELTDRVVALLEEKRVLEDSERQHRLAAIERDRQVERVTRAKVEEEGRLRLLDERRKNADLVAQIEEMRRRAEQGSQESQGETLEDDLQAFLEREFPSDAIEAVAKGARGGDVLQRVRLPSGLDCGSILWETKRTKAWVEGWVGKLKDDLAEAKAAIGVLVTTTLPRDVTGFALYEGVFVTSPACARALAMILHKSVVDLAFARQAGEGRREKTAALYEYVTSAEFRGRFEAILHAVHGFLDEIETEKRVFQAAWKRRQREIDRLVGNLSGLGGDLQGILGGATLRLPGLELEALVDPEDRGGEANAAES